MAKAPRKPKDAEASDPATDFVPTVIVIGQDAVVTAYGVTIGFKAGQREAFDRRTIEILDSNSVAYDLE